MILEEALSTSAEARYEDHSRWGVITAVVARQSRGYTASISRRGERVQLDCTVQVQSSIELERLLKQNGVDPHGGWRPVSAQ
jgi:hypothetical protein